MKVVIYMTVCSESAIFWAIDSDFLEYHRRHDGRADGQINPMIQHADAFGITAGNRAAQVLPSAAP
jgi:hypothetical protein